MAALRLTLIIILLGLRRAQTRGLACQCQLHIFSFERQSDEKG